MASWQRITEPVLMLFADRGFVHQRFANNPTELQRRLTCYKDHQVVTISDTGHNVQHDQPEQVADPLDRFLTN